ncbi:TRAP-type C4-dicarboxylate transport system, small permease component [Modicisalibacter muralis]|uniref:TRAP transporter small permease protein n=1 Tax=Modicisalibacter muralis TaxID=119000 RepID=A0A1G9Q5F8_9GAMM|nr:TRAP transporter small permease [Halomonas muralis]SDM06260.1 TRAP-type C4-dicarboxylate transport system, small permease component [Halomonas muralis]
MDSDEKDLENIDVMSTVPKVGGTIGKLFDILDSIFTAFATLALLAIVFTVLVQIISRLFFPSPPIWTAEGSKYLFIYMVAMASGVVIRRSRNVNVELFQVYLSPRGLAVYQAVICTLIGSFAAYILPHAWAFAQVGTFQSSPTLYISMFYIFLSTVFLFSLVLLYSAIGVFEAIAAMFRKPPTETESTSWN